MRVKLGCHWTDSGIQTGGKDYVSASPVLLCGDGAAARLAYQGLMWATGSNTISLLAAAGLGAVFYGWLLTAVGAVNEKELRSMPMGRLLLRFMR